MVKSSSVGSDEWDSWEGLLQPFRDEKTRTVDLSRILEAVQRTGIRQGQMNAHLIDKEKKEMETLVTEMTERDRDI